MAGGDLLPQRGQSETQDGAAPPAAQHGAMPPASGWVSQPVKRPRGIHRWLKEWEPGKLAVVGTVLLLFGGYEQGWNSKYVAQHHTSPGLLPVLMALTAMVLGFLFIGTAVEKWIRNRRVRRAWRAGVGPAPADWYTDPSGAARLRYWDGHAWTDRTSP